MLMAIPDQYSATVGMIGAGQLARMTHNAAIDLAVRLEVLARSEDDPAVLAGAPFRLGSPQDPDAIKRLASEVEVLTLDHELVSNAALVEASAAGVSVIPGPDALLFAQDKLYSRTALLDLGAPVPAFAPVESLDDVAQFALSHGWPVVMKIRTMGYDGRGVVVLDTADEAAAVLEQGGDWMVEEHVAIQNELALLVARRPSGDARTYPVIETVQIDGICHELVMPADVAPGLADAAIELGLDLVRAIGAAGMIAVELFLTDAGELLVNEFALRPHNSGHATIEGSVTSQFHNHLRAILDWPLGDTALTAPAVAMVNVLGNAQPGVAMRSLSKALEVEGASVHLYGKGERPGRKIGHVTALGSSQAQALSIARRAAEQLKGDV